MRIKKLPGCDISRIIVDFYDGRGKVNPSSDDLYEKGQVSIDISDISANKWITVSGMIPGDDTLLRSCTDLYRIMFSIEDGGTDIGTLLLDSIELADATQDCIPVAGRMVSDLNGDCLAGMADCLIIAENWLNNL
jgi:hypothetical protein